MLYGDPITPPRFSGPVSRAGHVCVDLSAQHPRNPRDPGRPHQSAQTELCRHAAGGTIADKRTVAAIEEQFLDDDGFWIHQATGLGILTTPEQLITYRLFYGVASLAEVSDRFHLKPLIPAFQPNAAFVLTVSQKSVNLYEFTPNAAPVPHSGGKAPLVYCPHATCTTLNPCSRQ